MFRFASPFDLFRPMLVMTQMMMEAQAVIALRLMGMAGAWPMAAGEPLRMVTEKARAAQDAGLAMARAAGSGASAGKVMLAGVKPVRRRTKANVGRLTGQATRRRP
jgi:hypothetical protein